MSQPDKKSTGNRPKKTNRRRQNKKTPKSTNSSHRTNKKSVPSPTNTEIINPTPLNSPNNTQLVPIEPEIRPGTQEISIWDLDKFPSNTKPIKVKPNRLKSALDEYGHSKTPIQEVLKKYKIRHQSFFDLLGHYDEIRDYYSHMRSRKSEYYGKASLQLWEELPEDKVFYQYDKLGNKSLTTAAVNYLKVKNEAMLRHAQICETGSFVPASKQEINKKSMHLGININAFVSGDFDLDSSSPDQLLDIIKKTKKAGV